MQPLPVGPFIRYLGGIAVWSSMLRAVPGQRVQDRVQLGTDRGGESALQGPHAVAALLQLQIAAVLLQLVIDGFGPVRVG